MIQISKPRFKVGKVVATPCAIEALRESGQSPFEFVARHSSGDWGSDTCPEDAAANEQSLIDGSRLLSVYRTSNGEKLWVITEADRSVTTLLLPEEY
jgi:hypothetical protein